MFSTYKRVFWLAAVMSLFVFVPFYVDGFSTDVWTRLARISEWAENGFPWKEQLMMTQNYPFGHEMHWTRPLDWIGYAFAWPFIPNWGMKDALEIMAYIVPVLVMLVAVRGFFFGVRGYMTPKMAFLSFWLFLWGIGYSWGQSRVGYFDHHIFHFAALVWSIALVARSFRVQDNRNYLILGGIVSAFGTWMTAEFFINVYILIIPFLVYWLVYNRSLKPALIYVGSYTLFLLAAMSFDHPMSGFWTLDFYRVSLLHVLFGVMLEGVLLVMSIPVFRKSGLRRLIFGALFGSLLIIGTLLSFGDLILVPMTDPLMYNLWVKKVGEMRPLYESWNEMMVYAILPLMLATGFLIWAGFRLKNRQTPLIMIGVMGTLFYATTMIFHIRVGISQSAFFIFLGSCYLNKTFFPREKAFWKSVVFVTFYLVFIGTFLKGNVIISRFKGWGTLYYLERYKNDPTLEVPKTLKEFFDKAVEEEKRENGELPPEEEKKEDNQTIKEEDKSWRCTPSKKTWKVIKEDAKNGAVFTDIFSAPQILWETGKPVLGGPYHSNVEGLTDLFMIQLDRPPYERAYQLLKKHQVTQVYLMNPKCHPFLFDDTPMGEPVPDKETLFHHAVYYETENMPVWLKLEHLDKDTNIKVFRVLTDEEVKKVGKKKKMPKKPQK